MRRRRRRRESCVCCQHLPGKSHKILLLSGLVAVGFVSGSQPPLLLLFIKAEIFTVDAKLKPLARTLSETGAQAQPCRGVNKGLTAHLNVFHINMKTQ